MGELYRRVILKPQEMTRQQSAQLRDLLAAAVRLQNDLAGKSAHVLRFTGDLEESEVCFSVEHELAEPVQPGPLFDPSKPGASPSELYDATAAILDAIRAAHQIRQPRPATHGGLCPGTLLYAPGGILKVTDFDFARCLQQILGVDAYLCLAVGPRAAGGPIPEGTSGAWEVVLPDISDRDDRICAFIDPSKHLNQRYEGFESKSDMVAAGFLLFLMAEHRHPYFYSDPTAHRSIDTASQIVLPSPFRRADLKESESTAVHTWCDIVRRMVALDWEKRPTAEEALKTTGVAPVDPRGIVIRQIEELTAQALERGLDDDLVWWARTIETAEQLAGAEGLPPEKVHEAEALQFLGRAVGLMAGLDWERSEEPLKQLLALPDLPPALIEKARSIEVLRQRCLGARKELDRIEQEMTAIESVPLGERAGRLDELEKRMEGLLGASLLPLLGERLRPMPSGLSFRKALLNQQMEAVRAEAGEWLARADEALSAERWDALGELLETPPPASEFDAEVAGLVADLRSRFVEHEERERERREWQTELEARLADAERLIQQESPDEARERLTGVDRQREFPELAERGRALLEQVDELERRLAVVKQIRQRVEALLGDAEARIQKRTLPELTEAERLIDQVLQTEGRSDVQTQRSETLRSQAAQARQGILEAMRRQREQVLSELKKAEGQLEKKRYREAQATAAQLIDFDDTDVAERARRIIDAIAQRRAEAVETIQQLIADARVGLEVGEYEAARRCVDQVVGDELAGDDDLATARTLGEQIETARQMAERERQRAGTELAEAKTVLDHGDFLKARDLAGRVLSNAQAEDRHKQGAQIILDATGGLAEAHEFITSKDYPAAVRMLDNILAADGTLAPSIRNAATHLREQASRERGQAELTYLVEHLTRRAELEDRSGFVRSLPVEQSIGRDLPEWAGQSLRPFETFLGDWVGAHGKAAEEARGPVLAPQDRFGEKYEIVRPIGRGGMGEVYLARDVMLDRLVALKLAPSVGDLKDLAEHLQTEAKAIAKLDYPKHILRINSFGATEGRYYFDTDYKDAPNLADYARDHAPLSHRQVADILIPIAQALDYAHRKGIYHRDIKPTNILVGRGPEEGPWLIDFGLAKISSICHQRPRAGLCGTPGYMAPEVIRSMGAEVDDRAADIFSLGCVLYELLTGNLPYQVPRPGSIPPLSRSSSTVIKLPPGKGRTGPGPLPTQRPGAARMLLNTLHGKPIVLDESLPEPLRELCRKALAPDPKDRFGSAGEFSAVLEAFVRDVERKDIEAQLAKARGAYESRHRNEPAELGDLESIHQQAAALAVRAEGTAPAAEVKRLLSDIEKTRAEIRERIDWSHAQIESAKVLLERGKWAPAIEAARAATEVGYEPGLDQEAQPIIDEAERRRQQQRGKLLKLVGIGAALVLSLGGGAAWWLTRPPPPPPPAQLLVSPADDWSVEVRQGGPFVPAERSFQLANKGGMGMTWKAQVAGAPAWLKVSKSDGDLGAGATDALNLSINTAEAARLNAGTYPTTVTLLDGGQKEVGRLSLVLKVLAKEPVLPPGVLVVNPDGDWRADLKDGVPVPAGFTARLQNDGGLPVQWTAKADQNWVSVVPAAGTLTKQGDTAEARITLLDAARALPPGEHTAQITFTQADKAILTQPMKLAVPLPPGVLAVTPAGSWKSDLKAGDLTPAGFTAELENTGGSALQWSAESDQQWVTLSPANGSLAKKGDKAGVNIVLADAAKALSPGEHTAKITFAQDGRAVSTQTVTLSIPMPPGVLAVKTSGAWQAELKNNALTPNRFTAELENTGGLPAAWAAQCDQNWVSISPAEGTLAKRGDKLSVVVALLDNAGTLPPGAHAAKITFLQDGRPAFTQTVTVSIPIPPGVLAVKPSGAWRAELKNGAFAPNEFVAAVENTGGSPVQWSAQADQRWLAIAPPSGTLARKGDTLSVTVTLLGEARSLAPGEHAAKITFSQDGKPAATETLMLVVPMPPGVLAVTPGGNWTVELKGGAFIPPALTASLENKGGSPLNWTAKSDQEWAAIAPANGSLAKQGDKAEVRIAPTDAAKSLPPGEHTASIAFAQDGREIAKHTLRLVIPMPPGVLAVKTADPWQSEWKDGAWSASTLTVTLSNTGGLPVEWTVAVDQSWLSVEPTAGTLARQGDSIELKATLREEAKSLPPGEHAATINFSQGDKIVARQTLKLKMPEKPAGGDAAWVAERSAIEKAFPAATGDLDAKQTYDLLLRIARVKYMPAKTGDAPSMAKSPDMAAWTAHLQSGLFARESDGVKIKPYRFIEFFWGPDNVHALCWYADDTGLLGTRYYRLTTGSGNTTRLLAQIKAGGQGLGDVLLGPIVADSMTVNGARTGFLPGGTLDSFGVAIAPDGPLAFAGLDRLSFAPPSLPGLTLPDKTVVSWDRRPLAGPVGRLVDLCQVPGGRAQDDNTSKRTAVWLMPTLGGAMLSGETADAQYKRMYQAAWTATQGSGGALTVSDFRTNRKLRGGVCLHGASAAGAPKWIADQIATLPDSLNRLRFFDAGFLSPRLITEGSPGTIVFLGDPVE